MEEMGFFNRIDRSEIRPGDHIYTYRAGKTYTHHGIYVGENKVIHHTSMHKEYSGFVSVNARGEHSCDNCGFYKPNSAVVLICLNCFLRQGSLHRYRYGVTRSFFANKRAGTCTTALSNPSERVVHSAYYLLHNGFGYYNVFRNNCEDFALYCKTELWILDWQRVGRSGQVLNAINAATNILAIGMVLINRNRYAGQDIGVRRDVLHVAVEELPLNLGCGDMDFENEMKMRDLKKKIKAQKKKQKWYN